MTVSPDYLTWRLLRIDTYITPYTKCLSDPHSSSQGLELRFLLLFIHVSDAVGFLHKRCREQTQCAAYIRRPLPPFSFGGWHRREWEGNRKKRLNLVAIPRSSCFILPAGFGSGAGQRERDKGREITCAQNALNLPLSLVQSLSHLRHLFFFLCCAYYQNA